MLQKLLLAINDCAWAYNLSKQHYIFVSPQVQSVLGITAEAFLAEKDTLRHLIIPEDSSQVMHAENKAQPDHWLELHYRIKVNGKIRWLYEKRLQFTESGDEVILSVIKDVSDQHAINYYLNESLGDFRVLFEKNTTPMWVYEIPSLRIIKVNDAAIEHYGFSQKEFLSMTIRDVRPKIDLAAFNEYIFRKGITKGTLHGYNKAGIWQHQNKSGEIMFVEITGYEMKYNQSACRIVIATDVTERVRFEQEIVKQQEWNNNALQ
jgi:PAS domain S-box-containing protein